MTDITVENADWTVIDALKTVLTEATIDEEPVFEAVTVTTSDRQARQCQFTRGTEAIIRYDTTRELPAPDDVLACTLELELTIAVRQKTPAIDESVRVEELLGLANAVRNIVNGAELADVCDWTDGRTFAPAVEFGQVRTDVSDRPPWGVVILPLRLTYVLDGATAH